MEVNILILGSLDTNCYLLSDPVTQECAIIDPADDGDFISSEIIRLHLKPKYILLTHGHFDHCLATLELALNFNLPVYLSSLDLFLYHRSDSTAYHFTGLKVLKAPPKTLELSSKTNLTLGNVNITVIDTPGHTPGSVCFHCQDLLFTGDTLIPGETSHESHSYTNPLKLQNSLEKLKHLPVQTRVLSGHGPSSYLGQI